MPNMTKKRLEDLRVLLKDYSFDGYIIGTRDEYLSEYVPDHAKRLEYITGFSGSNGLAIILPDICLFFTDGRYLTWCMSELDPKLFKVFDQAKLSSFSFSEHISADYKIVYDPKLFTPKSLAFFAGQKFKVMPFAEKNLVDEIWGASQPARPASEIYDYPVKYSGESHNDKIAKCRDFIKEQGAEALVISSPDSTCWLLNLRAHDVSFSPILLAYSIVTKDKVYLFTDQARMKDEREDIIILPEADFTKVIQGINGKILYDENLSSAYLVNEIKLREHKAISDPCQDWKACKNKTEIEYMKLGHIQDGAAVCEFLAFLANHDNISSLSEYDLGEILTGFRAKRPGYVMDSFPSICGYQSNGAVIHYRAAKDTAKKLAGSGLLLIDSGGQYLGATTDITRVASIGKPKEEHIYYYTKVLKGQIALGLAKFPEKSVTGAHLDVLARQYLWQDGNDYAHGTGHGVGSYLNVHEGPASISLAGFGAKLASGMVLSNEPGYYVPGQFGIRIENMMYVKEAKEENFLEFEMLTLVPYAKDLIDVASLTKTEMEFLKTYYQNIGKYVKPLLSKKDKGWLEGEMEWMM